MDKDIKIIVATHKEYVMPTDEMYIPLHVGKKGKQGIGYIGDDTGANISEKNPCFCELTGLYWAWKNLDCEYIGLAHYRRHLKGKRKGNDKFNKVISKQEIGEILESSDIILPQKRKYYIETLYSHYDHTMYVETLDKTYQIISEMHPEYMKEMDKLKTRRSAHMFNMFVMKKEISDEYCEWLFSILFELENRMTGIEYSGFHARFYGRVSELLLDVFINTKGYSYKEVPFMGMEKVNVVHKGMSFLKAKFMGKKYGSSF